MRVKSFRRPWPGPPYRRPRRPELQAAWVVALGGIDRWAERSCRRRGHRPSLPHRCAGPRETLVGPSVERSRTSFLAVGSDLRVLRQRRRRRRCGRRLRWWRFTPARSPPGARGLRLGGGEAGSAPDDSSGGHAAAMYPGTPATLSRARADRGVGIERVATGGAQHTAVLGCRNPSPSPRRHRERQPQFCELMKRQTGGWVGQSAMSGGSRPRRYSRSAGEWVVRKAVNFSVTLRM